MYNAFCHWFSALEVSVCRLCKLTRYGRHELCRRLFNQFVPALTYKCVIVYVYIYVCKLLLNCVSKLCICLLYVNCYSFRRGRRELGGRSWLWPRAANCPLCTVDFECGRSPNMTVSTEITTPLNPSYPDPRVPRYKFKLNQCLNLNLHREIPRNLSFSIWWISWV